MIRWLLMLAFMLSTSVQAESLVKIGEGTARWGWIKLYDAKLFSLAGLQTNQLLSDHTPLRLELCYHRALSVQDFVDGANHALADDLSAPLRAAVDQLHAAYQPVQAGDCYQLDYHPERGTGLLLNQRELVRLTTPGFKAVYFGIWLGDSPLSDRLKQALLAKLAKPA
jgi:hypothetical protein